MGFLRRLLGTAVEEPTTPNVRVRDVAPDLDVPALPELEDREIPIPEDGYRLDGGPGLDAVGESFYCEAVARATGGLRRDGVHMQLTAELVREPDNPHDPNAIAVRIGAETIAYVPRETAPAFGPVFERLASFGYRAYYCSAVIRGGWDRGDGTIADFRVVLHLSSPRRQMIALDRETVRRAAEADPRAGYANTTCPYCAIALDPLPRAKKKCPGCGQSILVRSGPDGYRYLVQEQDLHVLEEAWAEAAAANAADDFYR